MLNKGINRPVTFKGLTGQYIWWMAGGMLGVLVLFVVLYMAGVNAFLTTALALGIGGALGAWIFRISGRYGQYGLLKKRAAQHIPKAIRSRTRKVFLAPDAIKYRKAQSGHSAVQAAGR